MPNSAIGACAAACVFVDSCPASSGEGTGRARVKSERNTWTAQEHSGSPATNINNTPKMKLVQHTVVSRQTKFAHEVERRVFFNSELRSQKPMLHKRILEIPASFTQVLAEFTESLFVARPSLIPIAIPVVDARDPLRIVATASLRLNKGSLCVSSVSLLPSFSSSGVIHIAAAAAPAVETAATPAELLLSKMVEPRTVFHLAETVPFGSRLVAVCSSTSNEAAGEEEEQRGDEGKLTSLAESFKAHCTDAAAALAAGKRFSPALRNPWTFEAAGPAAAEHLLSSLKFRNNDDNDKTASQFSLQADLVIPLGTACASAVACRVAGLRTDGLPFDWVLTSLSRSVAIVSQLILTDSDKKPANLPFDDEDAKRKLKPLRHVPDTNRYLTTKSATGGEEEVEGETEQKSEFTHEFDAESGIVASFMEAERFRRRCERLHSALHARLFASVAQPRVLCCLYIGKPHENSEPVTVDGVPAVPKEVTDPASNDAVVIQAAEMLADAMQKRIDNSNSSVICVILAFNSAEFDFTYVATPRRSNVAVIVLHKFAGHESPSAPWHSIGHIVGQQLPRFVTVKKSHLN